ASGNVDTEETMSQERTVALYDETLAGAVKRFQKSRGIVPDGIVGPNTLEKMNVAPEELVNNIRINIERARWLPQDFSERYVLVNIARFTVGLYENERLQQEIKTVVGKYHQQTPVFAGSMSYVVFNPYWNVPFSILRDEIAPKVLEDTDYLAKNNYEVVRGWDDETAEIVDPKSIDWNDVIAGETDIRVRQKPGPSNALGRVKFMFPNEYAVYLHDTPAQALFERTDRAFSHGCIRLDEPLEFAEWVFSRSSDWDYDKIEAVLAAETRETVPLETEIPVYVTYFTAWAGPDGDVYFLDDVYNRDSKLAAALKRAAPVLEVAETANFNLK
ncbi:MAG: L,D-transpeptidase family protein, partial [Marinicaulis sp.]|nr:L,D-transpeptidase family protein [Marinicaulis sp.]